MSECRIWPGRTEFRQDDREGGVLFVSTRDACLAGRGANGVGGSGARLIILGSGTVPVSTSLRFPPSQPCRSRLRSSRLRHVSPMPVRPYRTGRRPPLQTGKYRRLPLGKT